MTLSDILFISLTIFLAAATIFLHYRNEKVSEFRIQIIKEDFEQSMKNLDNGILDEVNNYGKLPSYSRMMFSFKPLKKKYWL